MTDSAFIDDDLQITVYHPLYMFYPAQLAALKAIRTNTDVSPNARDLMYIPVCTTFIESLLSELFHDFIEKEQGPDKIRPERISEKIKNELAIATWSIYNRRFELVFGKRMADIVSQEVLDGIAVLYEFRNQAIHGKQILHEISNAGEETEATTLSGHYKKINDYFLTMQLLSPEELNSVTFINDKVVNHFLECVHSFACALAEQIMNPAGLRMHNGFKTLVLDRLENTDSLPLAK